MENKHIAWLARIEAIKAQIEAAKLHNELVKHNPVQVHPPSWFEGKADELQGIADETYKFS